MNNDDQPQNNQTKLPPIEPETYDGDKQTCIPHPVNICEDHTRDKWMTHLDYRFKDGVLECTLCPWGTRLPGNMKWADGKLYDLRSE